MGSGATIAIICVSVIVVVVIALFFCSRHASKKHEEMMTKSYVVEGFEGAFDDAVDASNGKGGKKRRNRKGKSGKDKIKELQDKRNRIVSNYNSIGALWNGMVRCGVVR